LFEAPSGRFEDALSGGLLVVLAVSHSEPLSPNFSIVSWELLRGSDPRSANGWALFAVSPLYYDHTIVL
jgi:hypothetical protein